MNIDRLVTESLFLAMFRAGAFQSVRLVTFSSLLPSNDSKKLVIVGRERTGLDLFVTNKRGQIKSYRPETAFNFLAGAGCVLTALDLTSWSDPQASLDV